MTINFKTSLGGAIRKPYVSVSGGRQENASESRNGHFQDAADRARNPVLMNGSRVVLDRGRLADDADHHNPWLSVRGGPELDQDSEDAYRAEKTT